jgi:Phasin protein
MSKRNPTSASKHARRPKITAKPQRANQAILRSAKEGRPRSVAPGPTEPPPRREAETALVDNPVTAFQDDNKQTTKDIFSSQGFDFSSAPANLRAYQAKLVEMSQTNMQFSFEYAQRLATIRSPVEIMNVIAEFTSKRIAMFQKYSIEMAELCTKP